MSGSLWIMKKQISEYYKGKTKRILLKFNRMGTIYTNILTGFSNNDLKVCKKADPEAPSTTR